MHEDILDLQKATHGLLHGYIVINETRLGPALGGTRIAPYKDDKAALADAKRLATMMSQKTVIAGLPFGGGKGVICGNPNEVRTPKLLAAYADAVNALHGKFYTGEDVGLEEVDVQFMLSHSPYFIGKTGLAGDPSGFAAQSAFLCIKVAIKKIFGKEQCNGLKFGIKGLGKTGSALAKYIYEDDGQLFLADTDYTKVTALLKTFPGAQEASAERIHAADIDVFVPCALGDEVTPSTVEEFSARIICGTANNQLANEYMHQKLFNRGIVHVPDYIANAGGVINVADELMPGGYSAERVQIEIKNLAYVLTHIWETAEHDHIDLDSAAENEISLRMQRSYVNV